MIRTLFLTIIIWCLLGTSLLFAERIAPAHIISLSKDKITAKSVMQKDRSGWVKMDQNIIVGSYNDQWVEAYSLKKQSPLWWLKTSSMLSVPAQASLDSKYVYLAFYDGSLMKVDLQSGKEIWQVKLDSHLNHGMTLTDSGVVCFSARQKLYLLDSATGEKQWVYDPSVVVDIVLEGGASPVVKDGAIFIGLADGRVQSVDMSGGLIWSIDNLDFGSSSKFKDVVGELVVGSSSLIYTRADGYVFSFKYSQDSQALLWKDKLTSIYTSKLSVKDPSKYIVTSNDAIFLYDVKDGSKTKQELLGTNFSLYETQSYLFAISSQGVVQALKDGKLSFVKDLQAELSQGAFIYNDRVYFASSHKKLYGFEFVD